MWSKKQKMHNPTASCWSSSDNSTCVMHQWDEKKENNAPSDANTHHMYMYTTGFTTRYAWAHTGTSPTKQRQASTNFKIMLHSRKLLHDSQSERTQFGIETKRGQISSEHSIQERMLKSSLVWNETGPAQPVDTRRRRRLARYARGQLESGNWIEWRRRKAAS